MKSFYELSKIDNYKSAIYYIYYKIKLKIIESIYNPHYFYIFGLLKIMRMQTNYILILADNKDLLIENDFT